MEVLVREVCSLTLPLIIYAKELLVFILFYSCKARGGAWVNEQKNHLLLAFVLSVIADSTQDCEST